jgi:hypothetical protein
MGNVSTENWVSKNLKFDPEQYAAFKSMAAAKGKPIQVYLAEAMAEKMERDRATDKKNYE